jgi:hypothetical protein
MNRLYKKLAENAMRKVSINLKYNKWYYYANKWGNKMLNWMEKYNRKTIQSEICNNRTIKSE